VFDAHAIWHERVRNYDDLLQDPQARHNEAFREIEVPGGGTALLVNHPLRYDGQLPDYRRMPFHAGQDSAAILQRLGLSEAECRALADARVIGMPTPQS